MPLNVYDGQLFINMNDALYRIGGSKPVIEKLSDMRPFATVKATDRLYFKAFSPEFGIEVFSIPLGKFKQTIDFTLTDKNCQMAASF